MTGPVYLRVALNGSGAGTATRTINGLVFGVRIVPSGGTPDVTIADDVDTLLDSVSVSTDTTYHPQYAIQQNDGTAGTGYAPFQLAGTVTVTIASGEANGSVEIWIKVLS
jgi:hypothetical protein